MAPFEVLVVDDEESMRVFLRRTLEREGYQVELAIDGLQAQQRLEEKTFDLVISDLMMPGLDGLGLLHWSQSRKLSPPFLIMTGYGSIPSAIEALKAGADNYFTKPFDREEIVKATSSALEKGRLSRENRVLKQLLEEGRQFEGLIGSSHAMRQLYAQIDAVADRQGAVLIGGESGTGKELVARAIHRRSPRRDGPFVPFHCSALPESLFAAELFGALEGAYTGSTRARQGCALRANGGTLFLDEIGDLPLSVQPALLGLLENSEIRALGADESQQLDIRVVAATNRNLIELVEKGEFRQDLYFRLNVFPLLVPPLRRRKTDVPDLVQHFCALNDRPDTSPSLEAASVLQSYYWPGNVRQLENTIERMLTLSDAKILGIEDLPPECLEAGEEDREPESKKLKDAMANFERAYLEKLLAQVKGNVSEAARQAGVSRPTLHGKIQSYRLDPDQYR